jgi:hypothetical protein
VEAKHSDATRASRAAVAATAVVVAIAACTSARQLNGPSNLTGTTGVTLTVEVGVYGGPPRPDGAMAVSNAPVAHDKVIVSDLAGRKRSAITRADGTARLDLPPGRYTVLSTSCGPTSGQPVTLAAGKPAYLQIVCSVP